MISSTAEDQQYSRDVVVVIIGHSLAVIFECFYMEKLRISSLYRLATPNSPYCLLSTSPLIRVKVNQRYYSKISTLVRLYQFQAWVNLYTTSLMSSQKAHWRGTFDIFPQPLFLDGFLLSHLCGGGGT